MSTKLDWIRDELASLKQQNLYNSIRTIDSPQGAWIVVDGKPRPQLLLQQLPGARQ